MCLSLALPSVHRSPRLIAFGAVWAEGRIQVVDILGPGPNTISFHSLTRFTFGSVSADHIRAGNLKIEGKALQKKE